MILAPINLAKKVMAGLVPKDIIYVVGSVPESKIKTLWFVYGDCYAADREVYEKTFKSISKKVHEIDHLEFSAKTNEIAGVRKN